MALLLLISGNDFFRTTASDDGCDGGCDGGGGGGGEGEGDADADADADLLLSSYRVVC